MSSEGQAVEIPDYLVSLLMEGRMVPFLGAGASMEFPSDIPSATQLAGLLVDAGYGNEGDSLERVADDIFEKGGWELFGRLLEAQDWRARPCNDVHLILAELAKENLVRWVITTNWDLLVEAAFTQTGVPLSPLIRADDFETQPMDRTVLAKLHGCLTKPEFIRATTSEMVSTDWIDRWAEVLFELVVRGNALLFVGYSGSSRAATATLDLLLTTEERAGPDYLVDIRTSEDIANEGEQGALFIAALRLENGSECDCGGCVFFRALRVAIFPQLLIRPYRLAERNLDELIGPTKVATDAVKAQLGSVLEAWREMGPEGVQPLLLLLFSAFGYINNPHSYVPIIVRAEEIATWWTWVAVALWTGEIDLKAEDLTLFAQVGDAEVQVIGGIAPEGSRRDAVALELQKTVSQKINAPGGVFLGVIAGGSGALPAPSLPYSVSRGVSTPSLARGGAGFAVWTKADDLLDEFDRDRSEAEIKASATGKVASMIKPQPLSRDD